MGWLADGPDSALVSERTLVGASGRGVKRRHGSEAAIRLRCEGVTGRSLGTVPRLATRRGHDRTLGVSGHL